MTCCERGAGEADYSRERGGVLFEFVTEGPGFLIDEPETTLGGTLKLPPQYEAERAAIQVEA